ncbi:WXG100 family type VII secretion target [Winogradskya humida]|uniref:Excreted virulence factor EspC (Type VII ESX diderm) n=1 Tax=Winogradskya humida TaxID=113566 RepID=A0ABQ3ZZW4_9ACTN|nr:type VII secretion target [Actinoplanes humidus]GIE24137.1 hypothetical protein Ahu01nite_072390 [Actinoplanes humidus]
MERSEVDPAGVKKIAAGVSEAAETVRAATRAAYGSLAPAGQDGWSAAVAAHGAQTSWDGYLAGLAGQVSTFGDNLADSATEYAATDATAADGITQSGKGPR